MSRWKIQKNAANELISNPCLCGKTAYLLRDDFNHPAWVCDGCDRIAFNEKYPLKHADNKKA